MRKVQSSSRWHGIFKALGFGHREVSHKNAAVQSHLLRVEPLEQRTLLSATFQYDHIVSDAIAPSGSPPLTAFTPAQIRSAYGIDSISLGSVVGDGSGQTIAIIDAYDDPNIVGDLHQFDLQFGLNDPPSFQVLNETGGTTLPPASGTSGWSVEESLDVEWAHAIAPQANLILFEADSPTNQDLISTAVNTARNTPGVVAVTMSFGMPEEYVDHETELDNAFTTPDGHPGVTFVASTGDSGWPAYPALSPNVVAVGGTTLNAQYGTYAGETGWSDSGGGISAVESQPSYQKGLVVHNGNSIVDPGGMRAIPDIAFDADPSSGVVVYDSYDFGSSSPWVQVGGTSLSSPCWAGLVAIADQLRASEGLGPLNSSQTLNALYSLPSADFHDITTGYNGYYAAGPGYDLVTGLGSPVASALVPQLALAGSSGPVVVVNVTHNGDFAEGDGNTYRITVSNIGSSATFGEVDLADTLPAGFTATAFTTTDQNWSVNLSTLTATTSESLAPGASYPVFTLTVNGPAGVPHTVINTATVSGGGETIIAAETAVDPTFIGYVRVWTGGADNNNWSDDDNWEDPVTSQNGVGIVAGDQLVFAGDTQQSTVDDLPAGTTFDSITFETSGFTISGNDVTLSPRNGVAVMDADVAGVLALPITLGCMSTVEIAGSGKLDLTAAATIDTTVYNLTIDCDADSTGSQWAAPIVGATGLTKIGPGTLTLRGANSYGGFTEIQNGTLIVTGGNERLPTGTVVILGDHYADTAGVLQLGDTSGYSNQILAGLTTSDSNDYGYSNSCVVGGNSAYSTLTINSTSYPWCFYGVLGGDGSNQNNLALTMEGTGSELIAQTDTYSGDTHFDGGTLIVGSVDALGTGNLYLAGGVIHNFTGGSATLSNPIVVQPNTTTECYSSSGLTFKGDISGSGTIRVLFGSVWLAGSDNSGFNGTFETNGFTTTYFTSPGAGKRERYMGGLWHTRRRHRRYVDRPIRRSFR